MVAAINEVGDNVIASTADVTPTADQAGLNQTVKDAVNNADVTDVVSLLAVNLLSQIAERIGVILRWPLLSLFLVFASSRDRYERNVDGPFGPVQGGS